MIILCDYRIVILELKYSLEILGIMVIYSYILFNMIDIFLGWII